MRKNFNKNIDLIKVSIPKLSKFTRVDIMTVKKKRKSTILVKLKFTEILFFTK